MSSPTFNTCDLGGDYPRLHQWIMDNGVERPSRLGVMREVVDAALFMENPMRCLPQRKGYSKAFALAELDQFIAGVHNGEVLRQVSPQASSMITQDTNYGVRIGHQMVAIEAELRANPDSRRAVAYIGHPEDLKVLQNNPQARQDRAGEIACSCVWNFTLRDGNLNMVVYTRSWDAVWGLCYDISSASAVQMMLARALGVGVGWQSHHATSLHLYEQHFELEMESVDRMLVIPWLGDTVRESQGIAAERIKQSLADKDVAIYAGRPALYWYGKQAEEMMA